MTAPPPRATLQPIGGGVFRIHDSLTVQAPLAVAYAVVADHERYPEFINDVVSARSEGEGCTMTLRVGPMRVPVRTRVEAVPEQSVRFVLVDGPIARLEGRWTFTRAEAAVTIALEAEVDAGGLGAWMGRVAGQFADRHLQKVKTAFRDRIAVLAERDAGAARSQHP
jgi:ribosome-associated toxin RatA of RatAB toxin-antitoxin module